MKRLKPKENENGKVLLVLPMPRNFKMAKICGEFGNFGESFIQIQ